MRTKFDEEQNAGRDYIFRVRENCSDSMFINTFIDQDFIDLHKLFVTGKRLNKERMTWQYYVKSRDADQYKDMVLNSLYHPPSIEVSVTDGNGLLLNHFFEDKPLVKDYIKGTLLGIEYLWGGQVFLDTSEATMRKIKISEQSLKKEESPPREIVWKRVRYRMKDKVLSRKDLA